MSSKNTNGPVGYGNPPQHTKFKKGKSGNPKGRPKIEMPPVWEDPIKTMLREEISITIKGKHAKIPAYLALLRVLLWEGVNGNTKAIQMLFTQTDGLKSIIDEKQREATEADRAFIDAVRKEVESFITEEEHQEERDDR